MNMKNIMKFLSFLSIAVLLTACDKNPDNVIYTVLDFETGAVLRTLSVDAAVYNSSQPDSEFIVTVEEQDEQDGGLFESVDMAVTLRDLTPGNGTSVVNSAHIKTIDASAFTTGPVGLPRATLSATYAEAFGAMGLSPSDIEPGDVFSMELYVNLTDGRRFGPGDVGTSVTGGFFSSPFAYNALVTCSPAPGDYRVEMHDSFGDGWQTNTGSGGEGIHVDLDGTIVVVGLCSPYGGSNIGTDMDPANGVCTPNNGYDGTQIVNIPAGTVSALWNFPGDQYGEISFEIYGTSDQLLLAVGLGEGIAGLLPVTECAL
jgi:hypothetical protein